MPSTAPNPPAPSTAEHAFATDTETAGPRRHRLSAGRPAAWLLAAAAFMAVLPTLGWAQFHHSIENFNVATALELRRGGPWLVPTLQGIPRLAKPPLTAWITAAAMRADTLRDLDAPDAGTRAAAYQRLAVEARWPALLALCLMLVATYELGRAAAGSAAGEGGVGDGSAGGHRVGLTAAAAAATTYFFVRHSHFATTDVHLALWVGVTNALLAVAVFRRRYAWSLPLAGVALGMALMAKGPVALAQTVLPVGLFLLTRRSLVGGVRLPPPVPRGRSGEGATLAGGPPCDFLPHRAKCPPHQPSPGVPGEGAGRRRFWGPAIVGLLLLLLVGGAWFVAVAVSHDHVWSLWRAEVTRVDADDVPAGTWYAHAVGLLNFGPWLVWMVVGAAAAVSACAARPHGPPADGNAPPPAGRRYAGLFTLLLLLVPLIVMSFAKDRFDRYLLPLVPAGATLAALGLNSLRHPAARRQRAVRLLAASHWLAVSGWAVLLPLAAATGRIPTLRTTAVAPWFSWPAAVALAVVPAACVVWAVRQRRRPWPTALAAATFVAVTVGQVGYTLGRSRSPAAEADLRAAADALRADPRLADIVIYAKDEPKRNRINIHANALSIYLNRTAQWARDPVAAADAEPHPIAWVIGRGRRHPDPDVPPGWELFFKKCGADKKYVLLHRPEEVSHK